MRVDKNTTIVISLELGELLTLKKAFEKMIKAYENEGLMIPLLKEEEKKIINQILETL